MQRVHFLEFHLGRQWRESVGMETECPYPGGFQARTFTYTPEYFAVKHYSHFITKGSQVVAYKAQGDDRMPVLVSRTPEGKYVVVAGNFKERFLRWWSR